MTSVSNQKKSKSAFDSFQKKMSATPPNVPTRDKTKIPETATIKFIDRDAAKTGSTLSLSSERFNFVSLEESGVVDSIDQASQLFACFTKKLPTFEEALGSIGYGKTNGLAKLFKEKATDKLTELDAPDLTVEDVAVIFCYTFEWNKKKPGKNVSPYRKLNSSLSVDRSNAALKKIRGFLFLLLQALRKLPRFVPDNHTLYRGMRGHVQTNADPEFPDGKPYAAGNEKTWWAFASTTTSLEITQRFLDDSCESTLFVLCGRPWGYDISLFSGFPEEKEILLEPERKLKVTSVSREGRLITVNAEMLDTPLILEKIIKVPKHVKEVKVKKSEVKEVPEDFKAENVTDKTVELSWTPVVVKGKEVKYQVVMKKAGTFNRSTETVYDGAESRCTVDRLEQWTEYEFQMRCGHDGDWGKWSEKTAVKTKMSAPSNLTAKAESWDTIRLSWDPVTTKLGKTVSYVMEMKKEGENEFTEIYRGIETKSTKICLPQNVKHSFRVRTVCGNDVSEWCDVVKKRTLSFSKCCVWKECPDKVAENKKYSVDKKKSKSCNKNKQ